MSYDFFDDGTSEYAAVVAAVIQTKTGIEESKSDKARTKKKKEALEKKIACLWTALSSKLPCNHTKFKMMHALIFKESSVKDDLKGLYQKKLTSTVCKMPASLTPPTDLNLHHYPAFTLFLRFKFKLAKPYISRDDEMFYICENPIKKDKVFKSPMIAGSAWKGNMRFAARMVTDLPPHAGDTDGVMRLFGNEKAASSDFRQGRLWFYDTFFDTIGLEVINPHDRKKKAGTTPVPIEAVPAGSQGYFALLYCPFDLMGKGEAELRENVKGDCDLIARTLQAMFLVYGFSAKKTSGYGVALNRIEQFTPKINWPGHRVNEVSTIADLCGELQRINKNLLTGVGHESGTR